MPGNLSVMTVLVVLVSSSIGSSASSREDTYVDLFILAGQSNAMGRMGDGEQYPEDFCELDGRIPFYWVTPQFETSSEGWKTLRAQSGLHPKGHFGPEISFARELKRSGWNAAVFKYSMGHSSIYRDWKLPGQGGMFDAMVAELTNARKTLEVQGKCVRLAAFVWIQGESDAVEGEADHYYDRLKTLIEGIRVSVVRDPDLPVILGMDEQHPWVREFPQVVAAQEKLAEEDDRVVRTSMIGLEKADVSHLNPSGLYAHGIRLFDAWKSLAKENERRDAQSH